MKVKVIKQEDGSRTIYAQKTLRRERNSPWYTNVPKEDVARTIEQAVKECRGDV